MLCLAAKWGTVVLIVSCGFVFLQGVVVGATDGWASNGVVLESPLSQQFVSTGNYSCPSRHQYIAVRGWEEPRLACVYGMSSGVQLARFINTSGGSSVYALKYAYDIEFVTFRGVCAQSSVCAYGQSEDTLVYRSRYMSYTTTSLLRQFSRHVVYRAEEGGYYDLDNTWSGVYVKRGDQIPQTKAFTVSPNGAWALVEVNGAGILRINLASFDTRRVVAATAEYGYGADPTYELGISNDGKHIAITGSRVGFSVYDITSNCGDEYTENSSRYFAYYIQPCPQADISYTSFFSDFQEAHLPEFSADGMHLSVYVVTSAQRGFASLAVQGHQVSQSTPYYIALGDSFTSGEGELDDMFYVPGTNTATNRCHVSIRSYPYLVGTFWNIPAVNHACSGARMQNVELAGNALIAEVHDGRWPTHLSVSVGGNDLNIMGKLKTCLMLDTCEWARPEKRHLSVSEIKSLLPRVISLINALKRTHPNVALAVIGYPSVVNDTTASMCDVAVGTLLNRNERIYLEETITYLNTILRAAAKSTRSAYIDIEQALIGERICDPHPNAMNTIRFGDDMGIGPLKLIGRESFHPTPRGHQLIAASILSRGEQLWSGYECETCAVTVDEISPSSYWYVAEQSTSPAIQRFEEFLSNTTVQTGGNVTITFSSGSLPPLRSVRITLHSSPIELAATTTNEDGSLEVNVRIPEVGEGYHTVHVLTRSHAHQELDIYQTVFVDTEPVPQVTHQKVQSVSALPKVTPIVTSIDGPPVLATTHPQVLSHKTPANTTIDDAVTYRTSVPKQRPTHSRLWFGGMVIGTCIVVVVTWRIIRCYQRVKIVRKSSR